MNFNEIFEDYKPKLIDLKKEYSVIILLTEVDGEKHIIFEERGKSISQPGEVSLPGGRVEVNEKPEYTAKREASEELGINISQIEIIGEMDYLHDFGSDIVRVFIGEIDGFKKEEFVRNDEVEDVFTYPVSYFIKNKPLVYGYSLDNKFEDDFPFELIPNGKDYKFKSLNKKVYFYEKTEPIIWGMTAKIISKFIDICEGEINEQK